MPAAMADAVLHLIHPTGRNEDDDSILSEDEHARAQRFVFEADSTRWRSFRAGLRRILASSLGISPQQVPLIEGPGGKPMLGPPHAHVEFNLSHSETLAAVVVSQNGPVGIDLEPWSRAESLIECAEVFCHPEELRTLPPDTLQRASRLLEIWTAKEAILKALGTGLTYPPEQLRIEGDRGIADTPIEHLETFRLLSPSHPDLRDYRIAVAVTHSIGKITWRDPFPCN